MLHPYVERVWSFGYVFSWEFIHYWLEYAQKRKKEKEKKSALFIIPFSIEHMYGCASLLHWVYVLERVRMGAYLWDSILVYVLGESMSRPFDFCERSERLFFRIFGSLPYSSLHPFSCDLSHALMQVDHHSPFYLFAFFYLYFIPSFHFTSFDSFLFSSFLMFDLGSISTLYSCLFDVSIPLSPLFV